MKPGLLPSSASLGPRGRRPVRRLGAVSPAARPVFLFSGLGAEYPEMGRGLYGLSRVFRAELDRCDAIYRELTGAPLLPRRDRPFGRRLRTGRPSYVQPAVFAFEYALASAWIAWGVRPAAVLGYSLGEDAAACVAGAAPVEEMMALVLNRARQMDRLRGGGMAVLFAGEAETRGLLAGVTRVEIAAANAADQTVVSGSSAALDALLIAAGRRHIRGRRIRAACAFHSSRMDAVLPALERDAALPSFEEPATPLLSSVSATWLSRRRLNDPSYWGARVRAPIRFRDALARLYAEGFRTFVEIGPHPMLLPIVRRETAGGATCIETARYGEDDAVVTMAALSRLPRVAVSLPAHLPVRQRRAAGSDVRVRRSRGAEVMR
ncbi:MAG TPA: acyltransferase domain-containing protein [Vicinamibacterales bacterium]|nr:acyltransferase domain-containing protein [Vicinamibacterales bacterium]